MKIPRYRLYSELTSLLRPNRLGEELSMDFITSLLPSKRNTRVFNTILVVVNRFSKLSTFILTITIVNTLILVDLIFEHIIYI